MQKSEKKLDLKDYINGRKDLFTANNVVQMEEALNNFLKWHNKVVNYTNLCSDLVCERCEGKKQAEIICVDCLEELW
jgi:hypothetical protein